MIHDDEISLGHLRPQFREVAVLVAGALAARAALGPGVDLVPQGRFALPETAQALAVAVLGLAGPALQGQPELLIRAGQLHMGLGGHRLPGRAAEVVGAALGKHGLHWSAQDARGPGHILLQQLALELLRAGGHQDGMAARRQGRHQVAQALAGARARLHGLDHGLGARVRLAAAVAPLLEPRSTVHHGVVHQFRHAPLAGPILGPREAGEDPSLRRGEVAIHGVRHCFSLRQRRKKGEF